MNRQTQPATVSLPVGRRLTRQESKALTRRRLLEAGKRHILRWGLGNAVAEKIAEEAGYSRGAFYGNFGDKEDLFLTVIREDYETRFGKFRAILETGKTSEQLLRDMRNAFADKITDSEWILLQAEFEAGALRNEKILSVYVELHQQMLRDGMEIFRRLAKVSGIRFKLKPADLLMTMISFSQGLAVNQRLLGSDLADNSARKLVWTVFDHFISTESD